MDLVTVLISSVTGIITFFVGHRRARKEVESMALDNIGKSLDIYNQIIGNLKDEIIQLTDKVKKLENKIDDLSAENKKLREMLNK